MSAKKFRAALWIWIKVTLGAFLLLMAAILILLPILTFLRVPSFVIGNDAIWFLRWQYVPNGFSISFNPVTFLAIAFLDAPWKAGAVLILYIIIQQLESYWLIPTVMSQ